MNKQQTTINLNKETILPIMIEHLEKQFVRYNPEMLIQYVERRLPQARQAYIKADGPKKTIKLSTVERWIHDFVEYDGAGHPSQLKNLQPKAIRKLGNTDDCEYHFN